MEINIIYIGFKLLLFTIIFFALFILTSTALSYAPKKRRIRFNVYTKKDKLDHIQSLLKKVLLLESPKKDLELEQLLEESGLPLTAIQFKIIGRMIVLIALIVLTITNYPFIDLGFGFWLKFIAILLLPLTYKPILVVIKHDREIKVISEVHIAAKHIRIFMMGKKPLYQALLEVSTLQNLTYIKKPLNLLLNEWLQDSDLAFENFRKRLGTKDGQDFAKALKTLNEFPNESTLDMLRSREILYKKNLRHLSDSKSETKSLLNFIIASLPFVITLITFIYPWAKESMDALQYL